MGAMSAILLADTQQARRASLALGFGKQGYQIFQAAGISEAIALAPAERPVLLLCEAGAATIRQQIGELRAAAALAGVPALLYGAHAPAHTITDTPALQALLAEQAAAPSEPAWHELLASIQAIAAEPGPQLLLSHACRAAAALMNASYAAIVIFRPGDGQIERAAYASAEPDAAPAPDLIGSEAAALSRLFGQCQPLRVNILNGDPGVLGFAPDQPPIFSLLAVPFGTAAQVYGALYAVNKRAAPAFGARDQQLAGALAGQAALAYENCMRGLLLQRSTAKAERGAHDLQEFLYSASHDLREPLRKVEGFGALLEKQYGAALAGEGSDYIRRMRSATKRMQQMLNDLLALSRVTAQARPFTRVDLSEAARAACAELAESISGAGAHVAIGALPVLAADEAQMRQLFEHLLDNAVKFRRAGEAPQIHISARLVSATPDPSAPDASDPPTQCCELSVADNGIGFEPRYQEQIFAPFQRLHSRDSYAGSGMGLAICRRIVERHGGTIAAAGIPGKGTTVRVVLPLGPPGVPAQPEHVL